MNRRATTLLVLAIALGCASTELAKIPYCEGPGAPALGPAECDPEELAQLREEMGRVFEADAGSGMVRVDFDADASISAVCVERPHGAGPSRTRKVLAERRDEIDALSQGPLCVANRGLTFNRTRAILDRIDQAHRTCRSRAASGPGTASSDPQDRGYEQCMFLDADWVILERRFGSPLVFVAPALGPAPSASPRETIDRCGRTSSGLDVRVACIESDGWELLR